MINREDMLELTRRMTPSRTSFTRVAGGYMEPDGEIDESFNVNSQSVCGGKGEKSGDCQGGSVCSNQCKPAQLRVRGWRRTEENTPAVVRNARVRTEK